MIQTLIIVIGLIISGSANSLLTKYQDMQCVSHCSNPEKAKYFDQPVLQTMQMFAGELLCWIPVLYLKYVRRSPRSVLVNTSSGEEERLLHVEEQANSQAVAGKSNWKHSLILAIPSTCDLLGTTLMNIGLLYTPVSIYQMTRGSVILIVGLMSVIFLKKRITKLEWMSLFVVFLGVFLVGFSGYVQDQKERALENVNEERNWDIVVGMLLVFLGIIMSAVQFVTEEHILSYLKVEPIEVVGYEGFYGLSVTLIGMIVGNIVYGRGYFDLQQAFKEMFTNEVVLYTSISIMFSISLFNFFGITLTSLLNATSRSTIDTCRTLLVWILSIIIGWESFHALQMGGFAFLVGGTLAFNGVIEPENWAFVPTWLKELEGDMRT